jgi:hypothetical protein
MLRKQVVVPVVALVLIASAIAAFGGNDDKNTDSSSSGAAPEANANIVADTTDSFCSPTGVDDYYTGNGHVTFYVTLRNDGDETGSSSVVPVRYYSDGDVNMSAMDMMQSDEIAPGETTTFSSPAFEYKAHEHEIVKCALDVDGTETEIPIS